MTFYLPLYDNTLIRHFYHLVSDKIFLSRVMERVSHEKPNNKETHAETEQENKDRNNETIDWR